MIKAVVFDMDGVLIDARDWHKDALNSALGLFGYEISESLHFTSFDGLPTHTKLNLLSEKSNFPVGLHGIVSSVKQELTMRIAAQRCYPNASHLVAVSYLKSKGYSIGCATNSIRRTSEKMLDYAGLLHYFDAFLTNEDVQNPKPHPDIYSRITNDLGAFPEEVLVVEDNDHGVEAAKAAGCKVLQVRGPNEVNLQNIMAAISGEAS